MIEVLNAAIVVTGGIAAAAGNPVIRTLFARIDAQREAPRQGELFAGNLMEAQREMPGGRWIGILERVASYVCLMAGFPMGLGMVLAIKGLGRYPELRAEHDGANPARVGELFIIGTLASMLWAGACAGLALGARALVLPML